MAARVRTRQLKRLGALGAASLLFACGPERAAPAAELDAALDGKAVVARVLAECHADLVGFDRFAAKVTLPDGGMALAYGNLPDRLRVQWPDGQVQLWDRESSFAAEGGSTHELPAADHARLRALHRLLCAASLQPLRAAAAAVRTGPRSVQLTQPDGSEWQLILRDDSLLPARLDGPDAAVTIEAHLTTSRTRIVKQAAVAPLGSCALRFDAIDFAWDESMFAERRPQAPAASSPPLLLGRPNRPTTPTIEAVRPLQWLCVEDPGDWRRRSEAVMRWLSELQARGQTMAGFAGLLRDGDRTLLAVPFRPDAGGESLAAPPHWDVRTLPSSRALAVYPARGDFATRWREGDSQLRAALAAQDLVATAPVLAQPFLHLDEGPPDAAAADAPVVRVSVTVR